MKYSVNIFSLGPEIIEIHWPEIIAEEILLEIIALKRVIENRWSDEISCVFHSYQVLSIHVNNTSQTDRLIKSLNELIHQPMPKVNNGPRWTWTIPVCYDPVMTPSQSQFLQVKKMDLNTLVKYHTSISYLLYFYGFLPGFMYLGGLHESLCISRKEIPDRKINKGSVAIGGSQTGIYPVDSPGGWYVIGKTPVPIFEKGKLNLPFSPGDRVRFSAITAQKYAEILETGTHSWEKTPADG
jgi:inhibitor of KinA